MILQIDISNLSKHPNYAHIKSNIFFANFSPY